MRRPSPPLKAVTALSIAALSCNLLSTALGVNEELDLTAVVAVALRLDGGRSALSSFVGPASQAWDLHPGAYTVHAVDGDGLVIAFPEMQIVDVPIVWPPDFRSADGAADAQRERHIKTMAAFLIAAEAAKFAALEHSSGGFTAPLFSVDPGQAALDDLHARYASILEQQRDVLEALDELEAAGGAAGGMPRLAAPAPDWKETLFGFFGYAGNAGPRSRDRILAISENMTPDEQADAFDAVREGFKTGAADFDELAVMLASGELDNQAAQIESDMRNAPGFAAAAQQANATVGQVVHQEGGQLVVKGAEFEVEVVKKVLGDVMPDITEGFDLADKAHEWVEYVESVYNDPLLAAEGELRGSVQERIKESALGHLRECCSLLDEDIMEAIAEDISERAMDAVPSVVESIQATQTAMAGTSSGGGIVPEDAVRVRLLDTFHEDLAMEKVSEVDFSARMDLVGDREARTITGRIEGAGTYLVELECEAERGAASYSLTYAATVSGTLSPDTGEFAAPYSPIGVVDFIEMVRPFGSEECVDMNTDGDVTLPFVGTGTLDGVIYPDGGAEVITEWSFLGFGTMSGVWVGGGSPAP
jgi:hypothetical protein